jgi:hypothetical protein
MDVERKSARASELFQKMASELVPFRRTFRTACQEIVREHRVEPWFNGTPWQRAYAREALRLASRWGDRMLPVHDVGCGIAQMMVLLHRAGFKNLAGCDREPGYVAGAQALCSQFNAPARIKPAEGTAYVQSLAPKSAGLLLSLNWMYLLNPAQSRDFFVQAARSLDPERGVLIVDMIRSDYLPPPREIREYESSYPNKWAPKAFEDFVAASGLAVQERGATHAWGRVVYLLRVPSAK